MWSLPDINRMNSEAAASAKRLERAVRTGKLDGKTLTCEHESDECSGKLYHHLWYDIFSDDPKGVLTLCEHHDGYYGLPDEGFFECDDCNRVMVENYTWEYYRVLVDDAILCLPCAAARYIAEDDNWIALTPENIDGLNFDQVRKAKHVIGVEMPVPKTITFIDNVEVDGSTGGRLTGFSSSESSPTGAVEELRGILRDQMAAGATRALLILDAAYQFSVSIGVYVDTV